MMNIIKKFSECVFHESKGKAYIFLNCDAWKSHNSMNINYNNAVYREKRKGRRALWLKVKKELEEGTIKIEEKNISTVRAAILSGNPCDTNQYITYGNILEVEEY